VERTIENIKWCIGFKEKTYLDFSRTFTDGVRKNAVKIIRDNTIRNLAIVGLIHVNIMGQIKV